MEHFNQTKKLVLEALEKGDNMLLKIALPMGLNMIPEQATEEECYKVFIEILSNPMTGAPDLLNIAEQRFLELKKNPLIVIPDNKNTEFAEFTIPKAQPKEQKPPTKWQLFLTKNQHKIKALKAFFKPIFVAIFYNACWLTLLYFSMYYISDVQLPIELIFLFSVSIDLVGLVLKLFIKTVLPKLPKLGFKLYGWLSTLAKE